MKIGLIDVDGHNFPSLPLMKLSAYHKSKGDTVDWWNGFEQYDCIYMSKVFTNEYTPDIDEPCNGEVVKGGTGYDIENTLPAVVENHRPDYTIYHNFTESYGFLTRGCPNNCGFCIVSKKEGCQSRQVAMLDEFWREQREIKLLDPNLLAAPEHEKLLIQLADSGAWVDFTQGLDIRKTNPDNIALLNRIKTKMLHFAWDNPEIDLTQHFISFLAKSRVKDPRKLSVYVLTNYSSTHQQNLDRVYTLRALGYTPYIMIYNKATAPRETRLLQRWVNNKIIFRSCERFEDYNNKLA